MRRGCTGCNLGRLWSRKCTRDGSSTIRFSRCNQNCCLDQGTIHAVYHRCNVRRQDRQSHAYLHRIIGMYLGPRNFNKVLCKVHKHRSHSRDNNYLCTFRTCLILSGNQHKFPHRMPCTIQIHSCSQLHTCHRNQNFGTLRR